MMRDGYQPDKAAFPDFDLSDIQMPKCEPPWNQVDSIRMIARKATGEPLTSAQISRLSERLIEVVEDVGYSVFIEGSYLTIIVPKGEADEQP